MKLKSKIIILTIAVLSAAGASEARIKSVDSIGITVSDLDRALDFYTKVLPFEKISEAEVYGPEYEHLFGVFGLRVRIARLKLGNEFIELIDYLAPEGKPYPVDMRSNDQWFQHIAIIVSDMERAYELLRQHKVQHASTGPQRLPDWNKNAGGIKAFYFRDPDGNHLEILWFPEGKGNPKWHVKSDALFLGIDHTAIVVRDTETSLKFYRDTLGFKVAGESENYGPEQERLNNVFGAHLRITAVRIESGPGIEFLEYLAPRDGRPVPQDLRPNDLPFWRTRLQSDSAEADGETCRSQKYSFISSGIIGLPDRSLGFQTGFIVRDPDGHAMQITE
jgi:catechol 2,3-dioxygenase-like lactoylglutathione lyase family enzyme